MKSSIQRLFLSLIFISYLGLSNVISSDVEARTCHLDPTLSLAITASKQFTDIRGGFEISDLAFLNDRTLLFSGFSRWNMGDILTLQQIQLDLDTGETQHLPSPNFKPLRTLYGQKYTVHVLSQSPDQRWQLAYVKGVSHIRELWLISKTYQEQLDNRLPWGIEVQWSQDSNLLWVTWSAVEAGEDGGLIDLNGRSGSPTKYFRSPRYLTPLVNKITFSPQRRHVLVTSSDSGYQANGIFSEYEVIHGKIVKLMSQQLSKNLIRAGWNTATQEEFLVFADGKTLDLTRRDGTHLMQLGGEDYQAILGQIGPMITNYYGPAPVIAYSESKRFMAVALGSLFVYSCKSNFAYNEA